MKPTVANRKDERVREPGQGRSKQRPMRRQSEAELSSAREARSLHASGIRGDLWFRLQRNPGGLYVEREERPRRGRPCVQSLHFRHPGDFERWCDDDPVRFEHPLLHVDLKRDAAALWELDRRSDSNG